MAANAITHQEIAAYCQLRGVQFTCWEVEVLCRIDDAVLGVWAAEASNKSGRSETDIPVSNTKGLKALFRGFAARKRRA